MNEAEGKDATVNDNSDPATALTMDTSVEVDDVSQAAETEDSPEDVELINAKDPGVLQTNGQTEHQSESEGKTVLDSVDLFEGEDEQIVEKESSSGTAEEPDCASVESQQGVDSAKHQHADEQHKTPPLCNVPISTIKRIIKFDPDVKLVNQEAAFLTAKATELFVCDLARKMSRYTVQGKRKTLQKRDLDEVVNCREEFAFLEGVFEAQY